MRYTVIRINNVVLNSLHDQTDDKSKADLWLLNSCTVKNPAEDHFRNEIEAGRNLGKYLVLAGCVSQAVPNANYLKGLSIIGVQQIDRVVEIVEETLKGMVKSYCFTDICESALMVCFLIRKFCKAFGEEETRWA